MYPQPKLIELQIVRPLDLFISPTEDMYTNPIEW
jgi:hypothetical protein